MFMPRVVLESKCNARCRSYMFLYQSVVYLVYGLLETPETLGWGVSCAQVTFALEIIQYRARGTWKLATRTVGIITSMHPILFPWYQGMAVVLNHDAHLVHIDSQTTTQMTRNLFIDVPARIRSSVPL